MKCWKSIHRSDDIIVDCWKERESLKKNFSNENDNFQSNRSDK